MPKKVESFEIWAEKYRPKTFDEMIDQEHVVERVKAFVKERNIPHMLFAGPAGVGKCVSEDTPIFTSKGLKKVGELRKGDRVLSLSPNGNFEFRKVKRILKRVDKCLTLTTSCGVSVNVTGEHPFLTLEDGIPKWKEAKRLKVGDYVAVPREVDVTHELPLEFSKVKDLWARLERPQMIEIYKLFDGNRGKVLKSLWEGPLSSKEIAEIVKLKVGTVRLILRELKKVKAVRRVGRKYEIVRRVVRSSTIPYKYVEDERMVRYVAIKNKFQGFSSWIKAFKDSSEFYEWLGYVLADSCMDRSRIIFHNTNKILLKRFGELSYRLFGVRAVIHANKAIISRNSTLVNILKQLFNLYVGKKKSRIAVPERLFVAEKERVASFVRAYFDCKGSFTDGVIEIDGSSKKVAIGLKLLLLKWGIISRVSSCKNRFRLVVSGSEFVKKFSENIGSRIRKISSRALVDRDVMLFARKEVRYVMNKLLLSYRDLGVDGRELAYLFRRGRGSHKKVCLVYRRLVEKCRQKIENLLKVLERLEMINLSMDEIESCVDSVLRLICDTELRKKIEKLLDLRSGNSLEYNKEEREPSLRLLLKVASALYALRVLDRKSYEKLMGLKFVASVVKDALNVMGISYTEALEWVNLHSSSSFKMENSLLLTSQSLLQLCRILRARISQLFERRLIEALETFDFLVKARVFWDRVKKVEESGFERVYDMEIEDSHNFVGGDGLIILHNTTLALVVARELYGKNWRQNLLQLNASDARGIDVIRGRVKDFARTKAIGDVPFKLIILDEADAMTSDAQQALRRTMEDFADLTRYILICNYSSKIIDPIQSRCVVFRFKAMDESHVKEFIDRIVRREGLKIDRKAVEAIVEIAEGDLRKVSNLLQASAALTSRIREDVVYEVASLAKPTDIREMLDRAMKGEFGRAREKLFDLLLRQGLAGEDIVRQIHREIYKLNLPEEKKIRLIEKVGEFEFRISEGGDPLVQLAALLAHFALVGKK